jgi:hypothetical protein
VNHCKRFPKNILTHRKILCSIPGGETRALYVGGTPDATGAVSRCAP